MLFLTSLALSVLASLSSVGAPVETSTPAMTEMAGAVAPLVLQDIEPEPEPCNELQGVLDELCNQLDNDTQALLILIDTIQGIGAGNPGYDEAIAQAREIARGIVGLLIAKEGIQAELEALGC